MKKVLTYKEAFELYFSQSLNCKKQQLIHCVFHNESTPSLSLNLEKGIYYCFGCGEKGNVKKLLKKMKGGI